MLRRVSETGPVAASCAEEGIFTFDRLRIDRAAHRVTLEDGREAGLTSMEFDLLSIMAENAGRVLAQERLRELTHSDPARTFDRSIDIRITRARQKIERDPGRP